MGDTNQYCQAKFRTFIRFDLIDTLGLLQVLYQVKRYSVYRGLGQYYNAPRTRTGHINKNVAARQNITPLQIIEIMVIDAF